MHESSFSWIPFSVSGEHARKQSLLTAQLQIVSVCLQNDWCFIQQLINSLTILFLPLVSYKHYFDKNLWLMRPYQ